jgi:hypothetical protein
MTGSRREGGESGGLIGEVRRFGLLSAATVVDRYNSMVELAVSADTVGVEPLSPESLDPQALIDGAVRMTAAYLRFIETTAGLVARRRGGSTGPSESVVLPAAPPGGSTMISLWAHNPTAVPALGLEIEVTRVMSPDGGVIPAHGVSVTPRILGRLDPMTSHEIRMRVGIPADQTPGWYLGLVRIGGDPGSPITVQLEVTEERS